MTASEMTLAHFFLTEEKAITGKIRADLETSSRMADLRKAVEKVGEGLLWSSVEDELYNSFAALLNVPLKSILVSGWAKQAEIRKHLKKGAAAPPEEIFLVPLAKHTLSSEHKPSIELLLNQQPLGSVTFHIILALKFEGAVLKIQRGRIREVQTGTCLGSGRITCEEILLIEKTTEKINLPGRLVFDDTEPSV